MRKLALLSLVIGLAAATGAQAIDRDAWMIDAVGVNVASLDDADSVGLGLQGETSFQDSDWSFLVNGTYDEISPDYSTNVRAWGLGLGLKYYVLPLTSVSGMGTYTSYDPNRTENNRDSKQAEVAVKQRLVSADAPVSPFLKASLAWRKRTTFSDPSYDNSFSEVLLRIGGGADFAMNDSFSIVFDASYQLADASKDKAEDLDGFLASVAMQYYWEKNPAPYP